MINKINYIINDPVSAATGCYTNKFDEIFIWSCIQRWPDGRSFWLNPAALILQAKSKTDELWG